MDFESVSCLFQWLEDTLPAKQRTNVIEKLLFLHDLLRNLSIAFPPPVTEVKKSLVCSENGLFASCKIAKGTVISIYPCHAVLLNSGVCQIADRWSEMLSSMSQSVVDRYKHLVNRLEDGQHIVGLRWVLESWFTAHMANDFSREQEIRELQEATQQTIPQHMVSYNFSLKERSNGRLSSHGCFVCLVATKDIDVNEEVLVAYGVQYWNNKVDFELQIHSNERDQAPNDDFVPIQERTSIDKDSTSTFPLPIADTTRLSNRH